LSAVGFEGERSVFAEFVARHCFIVGRSIFVDFEATDVDGTAKAETARAGTTRFPAHASTQNGDPATSDGKAP